MVNRNAGSGTRILIDRLLARRRGRPATGRSPSRTTRWPWRSPRAAPTGASPSRPWPRQYDLGFIPVQDEHYDFAVPTARLDRPAVQRFRALLEEAGVRQDLAARGFGV